MTNTKVWVGLIVVAIIAIGGYTTPHVKDKASLQQVNDLVVQRINEAKNIFGSVVGPDLFDSIRFHRNYTVRGTNVATSSTAAAYTLTTNELRRDVGYISWTPNINTTLTSMASTSEPFKNLAVGESFSVPFYNASTTAAATVTFAAGTGVDLQEDEGATVIVNGLEISRLTFLKKQDTDILMWVEVGQVGD